MSRSKHNYTNPDRKNYRFPDYGRGASFGRSSPGKIIKRIFYKHPAKRQLSREMTVDPDIMSLTPWNRLVDFSWWW